MSTTVVLNTEIHTRVQKNLQEAPAWIYLGRPQKVPVNSLKAFRMLLHLTKLSMVEHAL